MVIERTPITFSPYGGEVCGITTESESGRRCAVLRVADDGLGVPAADLPCVFERFHRGSNVPGRIDGTGIGLAGVKQMIDVTG